MAQISIIKKSDIVNARRLDAEYFKPEYLEIEKKLLMMTHLDIHALSNGRIKYGLNIDPIYTDSGINFIRAQNLKEYGFDGEILKIPYKKADFLETELLKEGDIIIVRSGANVGDIGITTKEYEDSTFGSYVIKIDLKRSINPFFTYIFLKTKYGKKQTIRFRSGSAQPNISIPNLKQVLIPILPISFQNKITDLFFRAKKLQTQSKQLYKEAEQLLLEELGLVDYKPRHQLTFTTTKKEIDEAKRFDAEFFQPKYKGIIEKIENYDGGFDVVKNILKFNKKNFFPKENEYYHYIPLSRVSSSGEIEIPEKELGKNLPTRARRLVKEGEIILSSISGSLETSALIENEHENFVVSNGFYVFKSNFINSETLLILFKSQIMLQLLQRISKGAILGGYDLTSFEQFKIPLIKQEIQKQIAENIQKSHKLRKESKELLEEAKRKVEEEIEKG